MLDAYSTAVLNAYENIKKASVKNSVLALFLDEFDVINDATYTISESRFAICHTIVREHGEDEIPADWKFQLGANALNEEDQSVFEMDIQYLPLSQLIEAGNFLAEIIEQLDAVEER